MWNVWEDLFYTIRDYSELKHAALNSHLTPVETDGVVVISFRLHFYPYTN